MSDERQRWADLAQQRDEARDEADRLRAEADRLRAALREIADTPTGCLADHDRIARAALEGSEDD